MHHEVYRFAFQPEVNLEQAEQVLHVAMVATEGLFGSAGLRLEAGYHVDDPQHVILVDARTPVGLALVRVFTGMLIRQFGEDAFEVRPAQLTTAPARGEAGAP